MDNITDIIWIQTAFIGDLVLSSGAFKLVQEKFPSTKQHLITTRLGAELYKDHNTLESVTIFEKKKSNPLLAFYNVKKHLLKKQALTPTTIILQAHKSLRSSLLSLYLNKPIVTFDQTSCNIFAKYRASKISVFHESIRVALLTEHLGVDRQSMTTVKLNLPKKPTEFISNDTLKNFLTNKDSTLIAISPGSSWKTKEWPIQYYSQLVKKLLSNKGETEINLIVKVKNKLATYSLQENRKFDLNHLKALKAKKYVEKITV